MVNMKSIYAFLCLLILSHGPLAQSLQQHIPADAMAVICVNAERYAHKVEMSQVFELAFFKKFDDEAKRKLKDRYEVISTIYKNPKQAGIDLFPKSYMYAEMVESFYMLTYTFKVADREKLEAFLGETIIPASEKKQAIKGNKYWYTIHAEGGVMMVAWTDEVASLMFIEGDEKAIYEGLSYGDPSYNDKAEQRRKAFKAAKQKALLAQGSRVRGMKKGSIATNPNYQQFDKGIFDVGAWVNVSAFSEFLKKAAESEAGSEQQAQIINRIQEMNTGYYYHIGLDFEAGQLHLSSRTFVPANKFNSYAAMYQNQPNKALFRYLNARNLMGFGSVAINVKEAVAILLDTYTPMLREMPEFSKKLDPTLQFMGVALDEDALANMLKGDMMLAFTDVREVESTYIDYVYDENYNMKKVEKTRKELAPIVTATASIGNVDSFNKLLRLLEAYGVIQMTENQQFKITIPNQKFNPKLLVHEGILLISNDDILLEMLAKGSAVKKKEQLDKKMQSEVMSHSQFFMLDLHRMMMEMMEDENVNNDLEKPISVLDDYLKEARLTGIEVENNYFEYNFRLLMKDTKTNAAMQLFHLGNDLFMMNMKE